MTHHWEVFGHDWAVEFLRKSMQNDRTRQAYLFIGPPNIGKTQLVNTFAMALNCEHPDVSACPCYQCRSCRLVMSGNHPDMVYSEIDPVSGALKIEEIRSVMQRLALKPYQSRQRIAIIGDFDHALDRAQDAFLKTLEEPPGHAVILLLAESGDGIMPTILSRTQVFSMRPVPSDELAHVLETHYQADPEQAKLLARISSGRIGWAINALRDPQILAQREEALTLLEQVVRMSRFERFKVAETLAKDKVGMVATLELWQTYWRDLALLAQDARVKLCNIDRHVTLQQMAYDVNAEQALNALKATQAALKTLQTNANPRLLAESLMLDYPGLAYE